jgi:hypothetical protein
MYLFARLLNSSKVSYKLRTSQDRNKNNRQKRKKQQGNLHHLDNIYSINAVTPSIKQQEIFIYSIRVRIFTFNTTKKHQ